MPRILSTRLAALASAGFLAVAWPKARRPQGVPTRPALAMIALAALLASLWPAPSAAQPAIQFTRTDYPVGNNPLGVAIGDLNGDGKPDMVVCEEQGGTVSAFFGDGLGGFGARTGLMVGNAPVAVEIRDLNGDGKPDLVVVVYNSDAISVLLGNGDGTFGPKSDYGVGSRPESVAIGDLNGDGKLDLAVPNGVSNTLSVLLGNGDGTFGAKTDYLTAIYPRFVAMEDLDGDAKPDVVVVNYVSNTVSVFPGGGDGSLDLRSDFGTGASPASVAIRDLNGDGRPDLAVTNQGSHTVSVLFNAPDGPVPTLASLAGIDAEPDRIRLTWYSAGNLGLTATVYRRTEDGDWAALGVIMPDGTGYLRYEDQAVVTGSRYGYRLGIMDGGLEVFVGEAWATAEGRLDFTLEGARPNPGVAGNLTVMFSLPSAASARLELLDISGRRVAGREVGSLGPGRHAVNLAQGVRIPPGVYLVRLTQGPNARVMRAANLN